MKRPLIVGVRPAGASRYHFRIYGQRENRFPPAELYTTLQGLAQWLAHGRGNTQEEGETTPAELRLV